MTKEKKEGEWFGNLIALGLLAYGAHWLVAGWMASGVFSECKERNERYNPLVCEYKTSEFRQSLAAEQLILNSLNEEKTPPAVRQTLYKIAQKCQ